MRRLKRTCNPNLRDEFLSLRKEISEATARERSSYISNKLTATLESNDNLWTEMRNLGLLPKATSDLHGFSPDVLNKHFAKVSCSSSENLQDALTVIEGSSTDGFSFSSVALYDVVLAVSYFSSQARGEDDIPQSVIAKALPTIGPLLVKIFNSSLHTSTFPEAWKKAQLIRLKKKSASSSHSDFRSIAMLSFLSKVLEELVHEKLLEFLIRKSILDPLQASFRKHHSVSTALFKLTEDIRYGFDRRLITIALLFDFSKASDTISHTTLLRKLCAMDFSRSVFCWIHSYIRDRKQQVVTKSETSEWVTTNLGVPQGFVLGPLLF